MTDPTRIGLHTDPTIKRFTGYTAHKNLFFDVPFISSVAPNLWQGGCQNGLILPSEIKHLVSLYPWESYTVNHELDSQMYIKMYDSLSQTVSEAAEIATWVNHCRKKGVTLVHCQGGLNRSSLISCIAMILNGDVANGEEAINLIREKRSSACLCNQTFENAVRNFKK